jgi:hypothetical protein
VQTRSGERAAEGPAVIGESGTKWETVVVLRASYREIGVWCACARTVAVLSRSTDLENHLMK